MQIGTHTITILKYSGLVEKSKKISTISIEGFKICFPHFENVKSSALIAIHTYFFLVNKLFKWIVVYLGQWKPPQSCADDPRYRNSVCRGWNCRRLGNGGELNRWVNRNSRRSKKTFWFCNKKVNMKLAIFEQVKFYLHYVIEFCS